MVGTHQVPGETGSKWGVGTEGRRVVGKRRREVVVHWVVLELVMSGVQR